MKNPKTNPSGKTKLLGLGGSPAQSAQEGHRDEAGALPAPEVASEAPKALLTRPRPAEVPLSHGKVSAEQARRWDELGKRRRSGG